MFGAERCISRSRDGLDNLKIRAVIAGCSCRHLRWGRLAWCGHNVNKLMQCREVSSGMPSQSNSFPESFLPDESDLLGELGRATTAYHEAPPERVEAARLEYERVLVEFKSRYSWGEREER